MIDFIDWARRAMQQQQQQQQHFIHSHLRQVTKDRHVHHRLLKENN